MHGPLMFRPYLLTRQFLSVCQSLFWRALYFTMYKFVCQFISMHQYCFLVKFATTQWRKCHSVFISTALLQHYGQTNHYFSFIFPHALETLWLKYKTPKTIVGHAHLCTYDQWFSFTAHWFQKHNSINVNEGCCMDWSHHLFTFQYCVSY